MAGKTPMRIVVFCPNPIGDTVMATPALRALRANFPDTAIDAVLRPNVIPTLDGTTWIDDRIAFHPRSKRREERTPALVGRLRQARYDWAVLLPNSFRTAAIAWLGGARRRIGYGRYGRSPLLTDRLHAPRDRRGRLIPSPAVDSYLAIIRAMGCQVSSARVELETTVADESAADQAWERLNLPEGGRVVCLNTGGAFGPAKSWPADSFASLARRLTDEAGYSVLVLCGPGERDAAREIAHKADRPTVASLADEPLGIGLSKASIRRSALLVTTDSGPRHFAAAFGVPVVSLFGPTHIAWTRTYHPMALNLQQPVPCGPCQRPTCREGHHRCMTELTPDSVFAASMTLLGGSSRAGVSIG